MATSVAPILHGNTSDESDYGSDFSVEEENIVNQLLEDIRSKTVSPTESTTTSSRPAPVQPLEQEDGLHSRSGSALPGSAKAPATNFSQYKNDPVVRSTPCAPPSMSLDDDDDDDIQYPDLSRVLPSVGPETTRVPTPGSAELSNDLRSPIQRFRSFPKKPLTVSDLASGAWCELQYWYTLTQLPGGKKTRTAAMRGGTRVHQNLEDQVHTTIQVNITTKEEAFALRLWNVVQGLRTLRDTGMTRELEVWGMIEGQIVNGIIDEVSYESPNAAFEQELSLSQQASIKDYLAPHPKKVYLTDVKTRASDRLPTGAALRPARVQLFLYHRLLGDMASGMVDFNIILDRYGLRVDALFSDAFMAQIGDLHDEIFYDADSDLGGPPSTPGSSQTKPPHDLIRYRSIAQVIPLLQSELRETFPQGATTLGDLVAVQYRHREDGRILGNTFFPNDPGALKLYTSHNLQWWRGDRDAEGVSIEETYKCRSCEFAESCQWRKDKEAEFLQKRRNSTHVPS